MVTIVLLPGMDGTGKMFADLTRGFKEHSKTIVVSYSREQPLGYGELEECVRSYLPNDGPFILVAESFSGPVALSLAASKPLGLIGVVLCCTFVRNPFPWLRHFRGMVMRLPMTFRPVWLLSPWLFGRFATPSLRHALQDALAELSTCSLRARLAAVLDVDYSHKVSQIDVPMIYLQATDDRIVPRSAARHLQALAPHMKVQALNGPHLLLQAKAVEAAATIDDFVRTVSGAS